MKERMEFKETLFKQLEKKREEVSFFEEENAIQKGGRELDIRYTLSSLLADRITVDEFTEAMLVSSYTAKDKHDRMIIQGAIVSACEQKKIVSEDLTKLFFLLNY